VAVALCWDSGVMFLGVLEVWIRWWGNEYCGECEVRLPLCPGGYLLSVQNTHFACLPSQASHGCDVYQHWSFLGTAQYISHID
jgi:hypothetical protein